VEFHIHHVVNRFQLNKPRKVKRKNRYEFFSFSSTIKSGINAKNITAEKLFGVHAIQKRNPERSDNRIVVE
jgi:hypothetical protein